MIGAGLAGSLLALALAERGAVVELLDPGQGCSATGLSYGGVPWWAGAPGPMDQLMASAPAAWSHLEQRHGPLGWSPCSLRLHWSDAEAEAEAETEVAAAAGQVAFGHSGLDQTLARVEALARRHLGPDQVERLEASPGPGGGGCCGWTTAASTAASSRSPCPRPWSAPVCGGGGAVAPPAGRSAARPAGGAGRRGRLP